MPENENKPIDSNSLHKTAIETAAPRPSAPSSAHEIHVKHAAQTHHEPTESVLHESIDTATSDEKETPEKVEPAPATVTQPSTKTEEPSQSHAEHNAAQNPNTPGILVLQWLTYVFWGWTNLILIYLAVMVSSFIAKSHWNTGDEIYYILGAIFILLPLSIVCDVFYSRKEPMHKTGGATILMILHAVIFAIFAIGSLIAFAFSIVRFGLSSSSDLPTVYTIMFASIIVAALYAAVFLRTLNPFKKPYAGKVLSVVMFIVVAALVTIDFVGPTQQQRLIDQDNQTQTNLQQLTQSIDEYANQHHKLPATLTDNDFAGNENPLIKENAVTYIRTSTNTLETAANNLSQREKIIPRDNDPTYLYFTLCVTYKADTRGSSDAYSYEDTRDEKLPRSSDTFYIPSRHKDGKNCYSLYADPRMSSPSDYNKYEYDY